MFNKIMNFLGFSKGGLVPQIEREVEGELLGGSLFGRMFVKSGDKVTPVIGALFSSDGKIIVEIQEEK